MPTKGKYIAGKQVSRWDGESEKVDIEYKNLDNASNSKPSFFSGQKGCALKLLLLAACVAVGMIVGYVIRRNVHEVFIAPNQNALQNNLGIKQDFDDKLRQRIQKDLDDSRNYDDHLSQITEKVRLSGVGFTNRFICYVHDMWGTFNFDNIKIRKYEATLSYPNYLSPNSVTVHASSKPNATLLFETHYNISNIHPEYMPFNAYSPAAIVKGKIIYANYGTKEDFQFLNQSIDIRGKIVIIKYGKIHPASKVKHAEDYKAGGVIFYSDPIDYTHNRTSVSGTWWLPSWAVQLSHVRYNLVGDPLTPGYSAINGVYRIPSYNACYPKIPCQPISYSDAAILMSDLAGPKVKDSWIGGLNVTYRLGPGYKDDRVVQLTVNNTNLRRNVSNLIAVIEGKYEKDKYIIIGAHVDSWTNGAVDAGTGYAVIWELARSFTSKVEEGWRPRRSILFALWDASKYGHIGSFEWVQEYEKQLLTGAVAYINLDSVIRGNYSFTAEASPLLYTVIKEAADQVPSVDPDYKDMSILQMWSRKFPDLNHQGQPMIHPPQGDSDHTPFTYYMGIPSFSPAFTYNTKLYKHLPTYPVYSTLDDTKDYVTVFIDPQYKLHQAVTKVVADVTLRLADSALIPLDVHNYIILFKEGKEFLTKYQSVFNAVGINLGALVTRIDRFTERVTRFYSNFSQIDRGKISEFDLYKFNDKIIQLPRVFITEKGLPGQPQYRNILVSPHPEDLYKQQVFPGIQNTLIDGIKHSNWKPVKEQFTYLIIALQQGIDILNDSILGGS